MSSPLPIVITGAAGFIGARFVQSCRSMGLQPISVDHPEYFRTRLEHRGLDFGKIIDRADFISWLKQERPSLQAIVHLGACTDTTELNEEYLRRTNLEYSQALWNFASQEKIPFIYASSGATYGGGELGYDDDEKLIERLHPLNPYGESKRLFDLWALAEEKKGNHPPTWAGFKFFNVYGFGERHKKKMASVVLHAFDQIQKDGKARLFKSHREGIADGHQKRDFIHVEDVIKVLHFARTQPIRRGIFNLGTGQARTFLDLVRAVFTALDLEARIDFFDTPEALRERYQYFTEAKMDRLRQQGYTEPFVTLESGVAKYVERLLEAGRP